MKILKNVQDYKQRHVKNTTNKKEPTKRRNIRGNF